MTKEKIKELVNALKGKKAEDVTVLDISKISPIADYFFIVSGKNERQLSAMKEVAEEFLLKEGLKEISVEGKRNSEWQLLDFGEVVVHLFDEDLRDFYDLEHIWKDAELSLIHI